MTNEELGAWIAKLEMRVIALENARTKDQDQTKDLFTRIGALEAARLVQKQLNAQYSAGLSKPTKIPFIKLW